MDKKRLCPKCGDTVCCAELTCGHHHSLFVWEKVFGLVIQGDWSGFFAFSQCSMVLWGWDTQSERLVFLEGF